VSNACDFLTKMLEYERAVGKLCGELQKTHQEYGVKWMLVHELNDHLPHKGGLLCDEMGLGKTIQVISVILGNPVKRTLVIVPKTIVQQWQREFTKFAPHLKVYVFDKHKDIPECDVVISSYSTCFNRGRNVDSKTAIHQVHWNRLVLDEAHEIRNRRSKIFNSLMALNTDIRWLLTGTPVFNTAEDFISLLMFVGYDRITIQTNYDKLKSLYVLRRTKDEANLSKCFFENVELEMFEDERKLYQDVFNESKEFIKKIFRNTSSINMKNMDLLECLLRARQCMIWPQLYLNGISKKHEIERKIWTGRSNKMETLVKMIKTHPSEKTLIFCQFMEEMKHIECLLKDEYETFRIDGSVEKNERERLIKNFKESKKNAIFIIQIKSGGQGLNLQEATRVYIMAPSWNPATELQAVGRSHRSGQTKDVYVKKLFYKSEERFPSVEESIMCLQGHKSLVCSEVLNDKRIENQIPIKGTSSKISINHIRKIFCV